MTNCDELDLLINQWYNCLNEYYDLDLDSLSTVEDRLRETIQLGNNLCATGGNLVKFVIHKMEVK